MMLAQFQARYPTGSLISELLTIYQGKFVIRVSVQIEGVTRATGIAAAETPELAEDRARSRAIAVLAVDLAPSLPEAVPKSADVKLAEPVSKAASSLEPTRQINQSGTATEWLNDLDYSSSSLEESKPAPASPQAKGKSDRLPSTSTYSDAEEDIFKDFGIISSSQPGSSVTSQESFGNVTPLIPNSYSPPESTGAIGKKSAEPLPKVSEPIDLSDAIARTTVEMNRLQWSKQKGREYLVQTYGKRSRQELTDEEMLEFLHYLESQPSP
jgi:hypothetical protein